MGVVRTFTNPLEPLVMRSQIGIADELNERFSALATASAVALVRSEGLERMGSPETRRRFVACPTTARRLVLGLEEGGQSLILREGWLCMTNDEEALHAVNSFKVWRQSRQLSKLLAIPKNNISLGNSWESELLLRHVSICKQGSLVKAMFTLQAILQMRRIGLLPKIWLDCSGLNHRASPR